ncbi:DMT family transporter [Pseudooceanicola sp.]|uniref:DMT family transporter n=1 Tax=Pseudooceanicola sp. TaxID=1914328 RepID=UPI002608F569|nr:DMT family transporter [Pseudooceanicola sp.]MDF1856237.1 DMT family transporter [Pseudooceanicola sp.]
MKTDRPLLGILLMIGFCVVAPMGDAVAKLLGEKQPLGQLLLIRFAVQALLLAPLVALTGRSWRLSGHLLNLAILRTFLHIIGIGMMFTALRYLPLADAVAIAFVMPFILLVLGRHFLGEEVGIRRLLACVVGFIGTLLVIQPSFVEVGLPALLPLGVALNFAVFILVTRKLAPHTDPIGLQTTSGLIAVIVLLPLILLLQPFDFALTDFVAVDRHNAFLLFAIGALGTLGHLLMTWSLRYAPSATLAPIQYLEIPVATIIGFLIFKDWPNGLAALGILITMAAGLYVVMRERAIARAQPQAQEQPPTIPPEA